MKVCNRYVLGCVGFCNPVKDQSESISRPTRSGWGAAASGQKLAVWPEAPNVYEKFIRVDPARIHCPIPPTQSLDNSHEYSSLDKQKWGKYFCLSSSSLAGGHICTIASSWLGSSKC